MVCHVSRKMSEQNESIINEVVYYMDDMSVHPKVLDLLIRLEILLCLQYDEEVTVDHILELLRGKKRWCVSCAILGRCRIHNQAPFFIGRLINAPEQGYDAAALIIESLIAMQLALSRCDKHLLSNLLRFRAQVEEKRGSIEKALVHAKAACNIDETCGAAASDYGSLLIKANDVENGIRFLKEGFYKKPGGFRAMRVAEAIQDTILVHCKDDNKLECEIDLLFWWERASELAPRKARYAQCVFSICRKVAHKDPTVLPHYLNFMKKMKRDNVANLAEDMLDGEIEVAERQLALK